MTRLALLFVAVVIAVGCEPRDTAPAIQGVSASDAAVIRSQMILGVEPAASASVIEVRDALEAADEGSENNRVAVVGQIGGMPNPYGADSQPDFPWVDGQAVFFLVDPTTATQFEGHQHEKGEECSFCLGKARDLADTVAMVQLRAEGSPVILARADDLLGLVEGTPVVVTGTARHELGMLIVEADGVHIKQTVKESGPQDGDAEPANP